MITPRPEIIDLPTGPAPVAWRRHQRARCVSLRIDPGLGAVVITLPPRAGRGAGIALLHRHAAWIGRCLAALPCAIQFADGAMVPLGGIGHRIRHLPGAPGTAWLDAGEIHVAGDPALLAQRVALLLRNEALHRLGALAGAKAAQAGLMPRRIMVKDTRGRWGSCSPGGVLAFSWRLVMAPGFVQDYVAAHEVAHLAHLNHGAPFWSLVGRLSPHAEAAGAWLGREGIGLHRIG